MIRVLVIALLSSCAAPDALHRCREERAYSRGYHSAGRAAPVPTGAWCYMSARRSIVCVMRYNKTDCFAYACHPWGDRCVLLESGPTTCDGVTWMRDGDSWRGEVDDAE